MNFPLPPNATIGIVGGGQLGRMSAMAAARLGYRCHIFTPEPDAPASQVASLTTLADYDDNAALIRFAESVDVITFEFENVSAEGLDLLAERRPVRPGPDILRISQDRIAEKTFLNAAGVRTAPWAPVESIAQLQAAIATIGLPAVLKTTRLGYDGKGQALIRTAGEAEMAFALLNPKPLILEGFVDFACECSVIVARGADGASTAFDTVENRHRDHILDLTLAPAPFDPDLRHEAQAMALRVAAVEFFIDRDGRILANEIAPRPHNSGHWTIDACPASQFELHIRAVAGLALPQAVRHSDAVMKNLVGPADIALWPQIVATQGLIPHHYGKTAAREGRKLGHVNTLFPHGALPGAFGIAAALGVLAADEP
ncbi:MAG: 5-(carboxyamino)imidazole ribonucleotide synthase [Acidiphilium sp. 37-64-53]|uniref:5-(carboxyamino)imidazole ribonucleotide synthase n=1 Tax=Acidiphilium sp. 37-64-53 TaxID=1970299 RepID=UPI000BC80690|nr:5-(carboxyamino)imidazole ribonucleotide synthase [Acidiphilium sp. 37-64-53]OYW03607.1 MAG: 5-(carboxyamino)imidazole ribonucleotide synthase [Acidiphilium sp. 37-64-53]